MVDAMERFQRQNGDMHRVDKIPGDLPLILMILAGGVMLRLVWVELLVGGPDVFAQAGEATRVAMALAEGRGFADAYYQGYGPTAHLSPATALVPGCLLWLFGPHSGASNIALLCWSLLQVMVGYLLIVRLFNLLGAGRSAIICGLALLCFAPVYVEQETIDFRWWEGATAACLGLLNLIWLMELERRQHVSDRALLIIAALLSLAAFVSPPVGLASGCCWGVFALRRLDWKQRGKLVAGGALVMGLLTVPWAIRNEQQLGTPVVLRSNAGLELALANHSEALSARPPGQVLTDRANAIHPSVSLRAREELRAAGGEVAYSKALGAETRQWIAANPAEFLRLSLWHWGQFYAPQPWMIEFSAWEDFRPWRARFIGLVNLAGLLALGFALRARRPGYAYLAIYVAVIALPYAVVQPIPRYTYLVFPLLAFLACDGLLRAIRRLRSDRNAEEVVLV